MANPCGTGKAHPAPGYERATYVGAAAVEGMIGALTEGAGAFIMAPIIASYTYDLLHICEQDPPDDPGLTEQDLVDALDLTRVVASSVAWVRIKDWFIHMMWPSWCQCDNATPVPPATSAPLPPANGNPGLPSGSISAPCWSVEQHLTLPGLQDAQGFDNYNLTLNFMPGPLVDGMHPTGVTKAAAIPAGVSNVRFVGDAHFTGSQSVSTSGSIFFFDASKAQVGSGFTWFVPSSWDITVTIPAGAVYWQLTQNNNILNSPLVLNGTFSFLCNGQGPNSLTTPCCPPDPLLDQRLSAIVQMLQVIANQQLVGTSDLVDSTVHTGLTNSGTITLVNACAAVKVEVTSGLNLHPNNPGSPNYYFSLGFITSIAAGSPLKGWRLVYGRQTFPLAAYADQVGYTLPAGVTVNITEQLAG